MKQAVVFLRGTKADTLTGDENGDTFVYDAEYMIEDVIMGKAVCNE